VPQGPQSRCPPTTPTERMVRLACPECGQRSLAQAESCDDCGHRFTSLKRSLASTKRKHKRRKLAKPKLVPVKQKITLEGPGSHDKRTGRTYYPKLKKGDDTFSVCICFHCFFSWPIVVTCGVSQSHGWADAWLVLI
jgi:predicted RNA-binding Zn-ribbon protein involved in translation (DUF1610 family)